MATTETVECVECPTCGRDDFASQRGMKQHHSKAHGESIAGELVECRFCGSSFRTNRGHKYCSKECSRRDKVTRVEKKCPICEGVFTVKASQSDRRVCCSKECDSKRRSEEFVGEDHPHWSRVEKPCDECGEIHERKRAYFDNHENTFCSDTCRARWLSKNLSQENNPNYRAEAHEVTTCEYCERQFTFTPSNTEGIYCSYSCRAKDSTGQDAPNWQGGWTDSDYGANWKQQRQKALERDEYSCVRCGISQVDHKSEFGRGLEVHHLRRKESFRKADGSLDYQAANKLSNLITVCKGCHWKYEALPVTPSIAH